MLILMADIHCEAEQPCSALPYALSAWLHATELGMDMKVEHPAQIQYLGRETTAFNAEASLHLCDEHTRYRGYPAEVLAT